MALLPKEQAAIDAARKRGMSQQKIDAFLAENTGDYERLKTQKTDAEIQAEEESRGYFRNRKPTAPAAPTQKPVAAGPKPVDKAKPPASQKPTAAKPPVESPPTQVPPSPAIQALSAAAPDTSAPSATPTAMPPALAAATAGLSQAGPVGDAGPMQPQVEGGSGGEVSLPGVGSLRQNLGQRIPPSLMSALAGLRRIY